MMTEIEAYEWFDKFLGSDAKIIEKGRIEKIFKELHELINELKSIILEIKK